MNKGLLIAVSLIAVLLAVWVFVEKKKSQDAALSAQTQQDSAVRLAQLDAYAKAFEDLWKKYQNGQQPLPPVLS